VNALYGKRTSFSKSNYDSRQGEEFCLWLDRTFLITFIVVFPEIDIDFFLWYLSFGFFFSHMTSLTFWSGGEKSNAEF